MSQMKSFSSDLFGKVRQPDSFQAVIELSLDPAPDEYRAVRMWRGQGNIAWPIHSTAYRRLSDGAYLVGGGPTPKEIDIAYYEKDLLKAAEHKGYRFQDGRRIADFELLARMRHHGAATRLIDATRNMLVALWFCATSQPTKTGLLLGIHAHHLGGYEGEGKSDDYDVVVKDLEKWGYPLMWEPAPHSPRVAAQHSQFLYSAISSEKSGSLLLPKEEKSVLAMAITPSLKKTSIKILAEVFDITRASLFPDFDGFSHSRGMDVARDEDHRW